MQLIQKYGPAKKSILEPMRLTSPTRQPWSWYIELWLKSLSIRLLFASKPYWFNPLPKMSNVKIFFCYEKVELFLKIVEKFPKTPCKMVEYRPFRVAGRFWCWLIRHASRIFTFSKLWTSRAVQPHHPKF